MHASTIQRINSAKKIAAQYYEPGNQSKSLKAVWRRYIVPEMAIDYRTFLRYLKKKIS